KIVAIPQLGGLHHRYERLAKRVMCEAATGAPLRFLSSSCRPHRGEIVLRSGSRSMVSAVGLSAENTRAKWRHYACAQQSLDPVPISAQPRPKNGYGHGSHPPDKWGWIYCHRTFQISGTGLKSRSDNG